MNLKTVLTSFFIAITFLSVSMAQDMTPPKPLESAYFDKWVGEWTGENIYNNQPGKQTVICKWDLNHQFLVVNVTGTYDNDPGTQYKGTGYYTLDNSGNVLGYWFDVFGAMGIMVSKGTISGNKMENNVTAEGYTGTETAVFSGNNDVSMTSKGTFEYNGQKMPFEMKTSYKRK